MSDEEIREVLDLGAQDLDVGAPLDAQEIWAEGRRSRTRGHAWGAGLAAAAAAAGVVALVWAQGLGGGAPTLLPAEDTSGPTGVDSPVPTDPVATDEGARGEPYLAVFHRAETEPPEQLSGSSDTATLEDLQGTWHGPEGEMFVFDGDQFTASHAGCTLEKRTIEIAPDGRLSKVGPWDATEDEGTCTQEERPSIPWKPAINAEPLLSLDGETLLVSGLDGTTEEPRVPASLTLGAADEAGFIWEDRAPQGDGTPLTLGDGFQLMVSGDAEDITLHSIRDLNLESPGLCGQVMVSSLRSDGILLAGEAAPWPICTEGEDALPPVAPPPFVVPLLQSGPTVDFNNGTMVINGTIPASHAGQTMPPPDDATSTSESPDDGSADPTEGETGTEAPTYRDDIPLVVGTPKVIVMSEGEWAPSGELTPLTEEAATGRRWLPVTTESEPPEVGLDPSGERGLSFDGTTWGIRDCGIDIRVRGGLQAGLLTTNGEPEVVPDPDPGAACVFPLTPEDWEAILTGETYLATDGDVLVIRARLGDVQLEPVGMALLPEGVEDPRGGETPPVERPTLEAGLTELPAHLAAEMNVSSVRDAQPSHDTTLSLNDGEVAVGVGCAEPLRGPAWFSSVGPQESDRQLTSALPDDPGCTGDAAADAELWRQMLAHGLFLHRFGDYVILSGWADPALAPLVTP